ncbi:hypothetical protein Tco_0979989 [Tanacetum coccineum]
MDQDSVHMVAASKVPMLKPGTKEVKLKQAVEKRFGGNAATKKTQRNLLKQHPRSSVTTATKGDTLQGSAGSKEPRKQYRRTQRCARETTTSNALISSNGLGDFMIGVIKQKEGLTNFGTHGYLLQGLTLSII